MAVYPPEAGVSPFSSPEQEARHHVVWAHTTEMSNRIGRMQKEMMRYFPDHRINVQISRIDFSGVPLVFRKFFSGIKDRSPQDTLLLNVVRLVHQENWIFEGTFWGHGVTLARKGKHRNELWRVDIDVPACGQGKGPEIKIVTPDRNMAKFSNVQTQKSMDARDWIDDLQLQHDDIYYQELRLTIAEQLLSSIADQAYIIALRSAISEQRKSNPR